MSTLPRPVSVTDVTATMYDWRDPPSAHCCRRKSQDSGFSFSTDLSLPPSLSPHCLQGHANFHIPPSLFCSPRQVLKSSRSWGWGQSDLSHWQTHGNRISKGMERPQSLRKDLVTTALLWTASHSCCANDCKPAHALSSVFIPNADIPRLSPSADRPFSSRKRHISRKVLSFSWQNNRLYLFISLKEQLYHWGFLGWRISFWWDFYSWFLIFLLQLSLNFLGVKINSDITDSSSPIPFLWCKKMDAQRLISNCFKWLTKGLVPGLQIQDSLQTYGSNYLFVLLTWCVRHNRDSPIDNSGWTS